MEERHSRGKPTSELSMREFEEKVRRRSPCRKPEMKPMLEEKCNMRTQGGIQTDGIIKHPCFGWSSSIKRTNSNNPGCKVVNWRAHVTNPKLQKLIWPHVRVEHEDQRDSSTLTPVCVCGNDTSNTRKEGPRKWVARELRTQSAPSSECSDKTWKRSWTILHKSVTPSG